MFIQKMGYFIHVLVLKCMVRALVMVAKTLPSRRVCTIPMPLESRCASDIGGIHAVCLKTLYQYIPVAVISSTCPAI